MGLKILMNGSGELCRTWYGRFSRNGQRFDRSLNVPVRGVIPLTKSGRWNPNAKGDAAFEKSRAKAAEALAALLKSDGDQRKRIKRAETQLLALTGQQVGKTPLSSLASKWMSLERNRKPTESRVNAAKRTFAGFAAFAAAYSFDNGYRCINLEDVTPEIAKAYYEKLSSQYAWGTVKEKYGAMRNAWKRWATSAGRSNPFGEIIVRKGEDDTGRVSRVPLTSLEVARLFDIVKSKRPSLFPLLACAACSGLRLGDACSLRWDEVHLASAKDRRRGVFGMIGPKRTSKTGAMVTVPIIQPLADVLMDLESKRDVRDELVFPEMLKRYSCEGTRTGLVREIKPFMALAIDPDAARPASEKPVEVEDGKTGKSLEDVLSAISNARMKPEKRMRLERIAREHFAGLAPVAIATGMGIARAQVSQYLRDIEDLTGSALRTKNRRMRKLDLKTDRRSLLDATREVRSVGKCRASLYGWHSLRATFVVLAVEAGVPLAYVEKVVGHSTTAMTLQYFNPTGKHAAEILGQRVGRSLAKAEVEYKGMPDVESDSKLSKPEPITAEGVLANLPDDERKKLRRLLLEQMNLI